MGHKPTRLVARIAHIFCELCYVMLWLMRDRNGTVVMVRIVRREPCDVRLSPSLVRDKGDLYMLYGGLLVI